jgi:hypothetical protein
METSVDLIDAIEKGIAEGLRVRENLKKGVFLIYSIMASKFAKK